MIRKRTLWLAGGSFLVLLYLLLTDPNDGILTATFIAQLATPIIAVWFAFLVRKALFDYIDMGELFNKAKESAVGAAIVFAGVCIVMFGLLALFGSSARAQDVKTYIPEKAHTYLPVVITEQKNIWFNHPKPICSLA